METYCVEVVLCPSEHGGGTLQPVAARVRRRKRKEKGKEITKKKKKKEKKNKIISKFKRKMSCQLRKIESFNVCKPLATA